MKRAICLFLLVCACGDDGSKIPPPAAHPPAAPPQADPAFMVTAKSWLMAGDGLTPKDDTWEVAVAAPAGTGFVDLWVDDTPGQRLAQASDGTFHLTLPAPGVGGHTVVFGADGHDPGFAARPLHVSNALYTVVSTDWDDSDNDDQNYMFMDMLRTNHPALVLTQFFGPYVITDTTVAMERRASNIAYMKRQHDVFGDEIAVHIHPRCPFVNTTPVTCRTMPSTTMPSDASGYTVMFTAYTTDEQTQLLQSAADLFMQNCLGRPTSFRAGGWIADITTIAACQRAGYDVESSAFPPQTIQFAWPNTLLASWTLEHWSDITQTSQPYYPSMMNVQHADPKPGYPVLEVPDNGTLVDYMSGTDMTHVLDLNWAPEHKALAAPIVFQVGFHPPSFFSVYFNRLDYALKEVDKHLYKNDAGPMRYVVLKDLRKVTIWSAP